jgi:hypothetical protein
VNDPRLSELAGALVEALRLLVAELVDVELSRRERDRPPVRWLTTEEYAEQRRTTPGAVLARIERGKIPAAVKDGRRWLIPVDADGVVRDATGDSLDGETGPAPRERPSPRHRRR